MAKKSKKTVEMPKLVTLSEVARLRGVSRQSVQNWYLSHNETFPAPLVFAGSSLAFEIDGEVQEFEVVDNHGKLTLFSLDAIMEWLDGGYLRVKGAPKPKKKQTVKKDSPKGKGKKKAATAKKEAAPKKSTKKASTKKKDAAPKADTAKKPSKKKTAKKSETKAPVKKASTKKPATDKPKKSGKKKGSAKAQKPEAADQMALKLMAEAKRGK